MLQSELVDFPSLLWVSALVFPHQFLCLPAEWVEHELVHVWLYMAVYTCTLCSCEHQRWRRKKKQWEGWPQRRGGYVYLYTKWCMRRPRTTQLDPVSVNTVTPPSNTRTQQRKPTRAPDTFFLCFLLLFFPLLYSLCSQDLLHSSSWAFLKLQVGSSLVTKEEDESRHVWGVGCVWVGGALCVRVIYRPLFPIVSVESFRLSRVAWLCDCCGGGKRWWYH